MEKDKNVKSEKKKDSDFDLDKYYRSADSPSVKRLNFGLWLAQRRKLFLKIIIIFLLSISAVFFIYSGYHYFSYLLPGKDNGNSFLESINPSSFLRQQASDLVLSSPQSFRHGANYDLAVKAKNPNDKLIARFDLCFVNIAGNEYCQATFVFPGEEKYFLALNQPWPSVEGLSVKARNLIWQGINAHLYPDWKNFYDMHTNFEALDVSFNKGFNLDNSLNYLSFSLINQTPYSFWSVPFNILIFNNNELIGVNSYTAKEFISKENRLINLSWSGRLNSASRVEIVPVLDVVAEDIYIKK